MSDTLQRPRLRGPNSPDQETIEYNRHIRDASAEHLAALVVKCPRFDEVRP